MAVNNPYDPNQTTQVQLGPTDTNPDPYKVATAYQATAADREFTPEQLVQNQITSILDGNNPYVQQAERKAMEYANSRGVLNSSIAAGAGRAAAIEAAMPIAQQDAGVFERMATANQAAVNQANLQNAQAQNALLDANVRARLDAALKQDLMEVEQANKLEFLGADYASRSELLAQELTNDLATGRQAGEYGLKEAETSNFGVIGDSAMKSLSNIYGNANISGEAIDERIPAMIDYFNEMTGGLTDYFTAVQSS